jgi:Arc/MetJ-type ribon-helix-helix transcriptional regulator
MVHQLLARRVAMQIELGREEMDLIERAIAAGRLRRAEDAIREALGLWIERERRREDILEAIDAAELSVAQGLAAPFTEASIQELTEDVKQRGRLRAAHRQG